MIDINKKYIFDGEEGTVLTTTRNNKHLPVIWLGSDGSIRTFTSIGQCTANKDSLVKLIEVKPTRWINLYPNHVGGPYSSRVMADAADMYAGVTRIACIEFKEGDGI